MADLSITLLGGFAVLRAGEPVTAFGYDKVRALLAFLAVEAGRPHRRERLAALLWPEQPRIPALQSLSQALYQLRRTIRDQDADPPFLLITPQTVQFNQASSFHLDTLALQTNVSCCAAHPHTQLYACAECLARLHAAAALYRGSFLEGFSLPDSPDFDEWSLIQREHCQRIAIDLLRTLWIAHDRRHEHKQALAYARQRLALDLWQEEAHRQVMQTLAAGGDRAAALAQFDVCRSALAAGLGIEPSAETMALYRRLSAAGDGTAAGRAVRRLLPVPHTPLIGRDQELATIEQHLLDPACRLLSLVGAGGSGKTHLALAAAAQRNDAFADGVGWVALGGVDAAPDAVPALVGAIAKALDFTFAPQEDPHRQLLDYLRPKQMLLLLDNFEHLADGARLLADMLGAAPNLKILVTSRVRLNVQGESVLTVPGLALPPLPLAGHDLHAADSEAMAGTDAVALFLLHARRVHAGYTPKQDDLSAIAQICTAVDGMPLAILLAAAWMDTLPPAAIAGQIARQISSQGQDGAESSVDFLAAEWADLPARQRSMRAVLDQSWLLLTPGEQQVLARLAVLRGGFTYGAAQAVAHATLHHLRALVEKSWLHRVTDHRYELHELLRQYAEEKLQSWPGASDDAYTAHCAHFARDLQRWAHELHGDRQLVALAELELDIDNARTAWTWALRQGDHVALGQMVEGICRYFDWRGPYQQGMELCHQALAQLRPVLEMQPIGLLAQLLAWQGHFSRVIGDPTAADAALQEALALLAAGACMPGDADDTRALHAFALHEHAHLMMGENRVRARQILAECLHLYRSARDRNGTAQVLNTLGDLYFSCGEYGAGLAVLEEALALGRGLGDSRLVAESLHRAGVIRAAQGEIELAGRLHQESTSISRKIGARWDVAEGELELASVLMYSGRFAEAAAYYAQSAEHHAALGSRGGYATAVHLLGWADTNLGEYAAALEHFRLGEEIWRVEENGPGLGLSGLGCGGIALAMADYAQAREQLSASVARFAAVQQRAEQAITLGILAAALHDLGQPQAARGCVHQALAITRTTGAFAPVHFALEAYALMLADGGMPARGLELYTFTARHPYVHNSCWHADCFGRRIDARAAALRPAEAAAARARGLAGNAKTVVMDVLAELEAELEVANVEDLYMM